MTTQAVIKWLWNHTPEIFQLFILVFGGMLVAWFFSIISLAIDEQEHP
jgi:hypothetical protein